MRNTANAPRPAGTTSVLAWGIHLLLLGSGLLLFPQPLVTLFNLPFGGGFGERMLGVLTLVLGLYYLLAGLQQNTAMYRWKLYGHGLGVSIMVLLMATGNAPIGLTGTALMDVAAGAWTWTALRNAD